GDEHISCERELIALNLPGNVRDCMDAIELNSGRINVFHSEAGGPENVNPDEVAVLGVDDSVFMRVDQDGRGGRRVGGDWRGRAHHEVLFWKERLADAGVVGRAAEAADGDDGLRRKGFTRYLLVELGKMSDRELEAGMRRSIDGVDVSFKSG